MHPSLNCAKGEKAIVSGSPYRDPAILRSKAQNRAARVQASSARLVEPEEASHALSPPNKNAPVGSNFVWRRESPPTC